jgi:CubicO group peptidase (beta-lactamase class C family)
MITRMVFFGCIGFLLLASLTAAAQTDEKKQKRNWTRRGGKSDQFEELQKTLRNAVEQPGLPGLSLRVLVKGDVVFDEGFGLFNVDSGRVFSTEEHCWIASITKSVAATLIAALVDRKMLKFTDPVDMYIEEFKSLKMIDTGEPVRSPTVAECLSHTAGFDCNDARGVWRFPAIYSGNIADVSREIAAKGLRFEPGTQTAYSRLGFDITARVAEVVAGKPYPEVLSEYLLIPLGMADTTFHPSEEIRGRISFKSVASTTPTTKAVDPFTMSGGGYVNTGSGLVSTAEDLVRFFRFHHDLGRVGKEKVIDKKTLRLMYVLQPAATGYGLGFSLEDLDRKNAGQVIRHGGGTGTMSWLDRNRDIIFIGLSQAGTDNAKSAWTNARKVIHAAFIPGYKRKLPKKKPAGKTKKQAGSNFDLLDKNRDGLLTKKELPTNLRGRFSDADRDGDGFVSREEFDRAVKQKSSRD